MIFGIVTIVYIIYANAIPHGAVIVYNDWNSQRYVIYRDATSQTKKSSQCVPQCSHKQKIEPMCT